MGYDLRTESWIPFRRLSGRIDWGPPQLIVDAITTDPVVALATPRADFDGALTEFLIGLLAAVYQLPSEEEWRKHWHRPPARDDLQRAILALPPAFELEGDGPRFLQDFSADDLASAEVAPVQEILVDGKNDPLFMKPESLRQIGRPAAAMALITIQAYSPAGGRGHRTSLRGGGPLTTLVDPRQNPGRANPIDLSLWRYLWANVPILAALSGHGAAGKDAAAPSAIFPWLAPTRTSEGDRATTVADVNALQCFFGMPRRIRLEFSDVPGRCDLTGREDERPITGFRVKGYGVQYKGWRHPLTPYYAGKVQNEWLPIHGQPGGIGWRDWYPLIHAGAAETKVPAAVITTFNDRRASQVDCERYSLHAFGFDVTNAKVRSWIDTRLPAFVEQDLDRLEKVSAMIGWLTAGTEFAAYVLQKAVTTALYADSDGPPGDLSFIKSSLWAGTEAPFYAAVFRVLESGNPDHPLELADLQQGFQRTLVTVGGEIFDSHVSADATHPEQLRRSIIARFDLMMTLRGNGKQGEKLFSALGLTTGTVRRTRNAGKRATQEASA